MADVDSALAGATVIKADSTVDYVIDKDLRTVAIPTRGVVLGVVGDKDTNSVRFEMPQVYKGVDLSVFSCQVDFDNAAGDRGAYIVDDVAASDGTMSFTWLVGSLACASAGDVTFSVRFVKLDGDDIGQSYGSTTATASVLDSLDSSGTVDATAEGDILALIDSRTQYVYDVAKSATEAANRAATASTDAKGAAASAEEAASNANLAAETAASSAKANANVWMDYDDDGYLCIYESEGD